MISSQSSWQKGKALPCIDHTTDVSIMPTANKVDEPEPPSSKRGGCQSAPPSLGSGLMKFVFDCIAICGHAQLLIGAYAAGYAGVVWVLMALPGTPWITSFDTLMIPTLQALSTYGFDRITKVDPDEDTLTHGDRVSFALRFRTVLTVGYFAAFVVGLIRAAFYGLTGVVLYLSPVVAALLYGAPLLTGGRRPKDILGVKNLTVAVSWTLGSGVLPYWILAPYTHSSWLVTTCVLSFVFLRVTATTMSGDFADIPADRQNGVRTLPVVLGRDRARQCLSVALFGSWLALAVAGWWTIGVNAVGVSTLSSVGFWVFLSRFTREPAFGILYYDFTEFDTPLLALGLLLCRGVIPFTTE